MINEYYRTEKAIKEGGVKVPPSFNYAKLRSNTIKAIVAIIPITTGQFTSSSSGGEMIF
ncbi:hypothetical protein [uncultured Marivirga sp.]|uniref:hypothetical protein n=1 Tax=uncultured Marivirga sp. TaxID=1123707 RepID=UPI0030EC4351|tara:strand:+ start:453936 stop:454112 length:177 start_codon:yes stop_codon:yes gene_type:complete